MLNKAWLITPYVLQEWLKERFYNVYLSSIDDFLNRVEAGEIFTSGGLLFFDIEAVYSDGKVFFSYEVNSLAPKEATKPMLFQFKEHESADVYVVDVWCGEFTDERVRNTLMLLHLLDKRGYRFVAHNGRSFDLPVMSGFYRYYYPKCHLLFRRLDEKLIDTIEYSRNKTNNNAHGLKSLMIKYFGLSIDKSFQKVNWALRPLTEQMLLYAGLDTVYLEALYNKMVLGKRYRGEEKQITIEELLKEV